MHCIECDKHTKDCQCPDMDDRLRGLMREGDELEVLEAKNALYERLAGRTITLTSGQDMTEEQVEVLEWALNRKWAEHARLN